MCGICGTWGRPDPAAVRAMVGAMHHRGPDDRGVWHDERIALGMARLSILDLSAAAHQPMATPDGGIHLVYNGETYNFADERRQLAAAGVPFTSHSDTEVVLRLYERHGDDFLLRLRGMFALALYDRRGGPGRERLLLARDQLGIKPLLYADSPGRLVFASELKALLACGLIGRELDPAALRLLLTLGSVYPPRTLLRAVRALPPAHRLIADAAGVRVERYWRLAVGRRADVARLPYPGQVEAVRAALAESVRLHRVSDVPLGAFLSGGVDSSLLVALLAREVGQPVRTFSVGFAAEGAALDETDAARRTAAFLGTNHTRVEVTGADVAAALPALIRGLDQPSVDGVNSYFVSQAARRGVTVALSGTGGDELFAGYPWFMLMANAAHQPPRAWRRALAGLARHPGWDRWLAGPCGPRLAHWRGVGGFLPRYAQCYRICDPPAAARLLHPDLRRAARAGRDPARDLAPTDELPDAPPVPRVSALCLRGYTASQLLRDIDAVSMAHSLEVRVPFLDLPLVDLALSLPDDAKLGPPDPAFDAAHTTYRSSGAKRVLIDAARPLLPPDFDQQPKRGFALPFDAWLRGPLRAAWQEAADDLATDARDLFAPGAVAALAARYAAGQLDWPQPWLLLVFARWRREFLSPRTPDRA